jgi:hypothetical protein
MTPAMRSASAPERSTEARKTSFTRSPKVALSRRSWANACTVRISWRVSSTWLATSATRSCTARDSRRTRLPRRPIGASTTGIPASARIESFTLVKKSIATQPTSVTAMRSA